MALPVRDWDKRTKYDSLLIVSTRKKHDSGWAMMAIIGVCDNAPQEIAVSCCDDIEWKLPAMRFDGLIGQFRTDCAIKSGAIHAWQRDSYFIVGEALSSTTIELINM